MDCQEISVKRSFLPVSACAKSHILLVDDDSTSLLVFSSVLRSWRCEVETAQHPEDALATIRAKEGSFDLVITDYHMPDMNGLQLLKKVQDEFRLPVIIMSCDDRQRISWKKLSDNGASLFFLMKPLTIKELKYIWQYAITGRKGKCSEKASSGIPRALLPDMYDHPSYDENGSDYMLPMSEHGNKKQRKGIQQLISDNQNTTKRKAKVVWTPQLHNRFLQAINLLGVDKSVPKTILELMNVRGLTRENVASHLQKYRIFLKRAADKGPPDNKIYIGGKALSSSNLAQESLLSPSSSTIQDAVQRTPVLYESMCFPSLNGLGSGGVSSILGGSSIHLVPSLNQHASRSANSRFSNFGTKFLSNQVGTRNAPSDDTNNSSFETINSPSINHVNLLTRNFSKHQSLIYSNQMYQQQLELAKPDFSGIGHPDCSSIVCGIPNNVQPFTYGEFRLMSNISSASNSHPTRSNIDDACLTGNRKRVGVIQDGINDNRNGCPIVNLDYLLSSGCNQTQKASGSLPAAETQAGRTIAGENVDLSGTMNNPSPQMTNNYEQLLDEKNVNQVFTHHVNCETRTKHLAGENTGQIHLPEINSGDNVTQLNALGRQPQGSSFSNLLLAPWNEEPFTNEHQARDTVAEVLVTNDCCFPLMDQYHSQEKASGDLPNFIPPHMNQKGEGMNPSGNQILDNQEWHEDFVRALLDTTSEQVKELL